MVNRSNDIALADPDVAGEGSARQRPSSLSVVIPALNEENGIDAILERVLAQRSGLADVGIQTVMGAVAGVESIEPLEIIGRDVIPQAAKL